MNGIDRIHLLQKIPPTVLTAKDQAIESVTSSAREVKEFIQDRTSHFFPPPVKYSIESLDEDAWVMGPDFVIAKKLSWALYAYETVFKKAKTTSSVGPGNGYFETARLLLEQIEFIAEKLGYLEHVDRSSYHTLLEKLFPNVPELTKGAIYPVVLYFIALRIKEMNDIDCGQKRENDFWLVSCFPSKKLHYSALLLLSASFCLFNTIRYCDERDFEMMYLQFEEHWKAFFEQLLQESHSISWCPDIEIHLLMKHLHQTSLYEKKRNAAKRVASYFGANEEKVIQSLKIYPRRLNNTYENNRAYNLAKLCLELASKTITYSSSDFFFEAKILSFQ